MVTSSVKDLGNISDPSTLVRSFKILNLVRLPSSLILFLELVNLAVVMILEETLQLVLLTHKARGPTDTVGIYIYVSKLNVFV